MGVHTQYGQEEKKEERNSPAWLKEGFRPDDSGVQPALIRSRKKPSESVGGL